MPCYITRTGSFLPGPPVENDQIETFLGALDGEADIKQRVLRLNGIVRRHYAQDHQQQCTHDVYQLACRAVQACLGAPPIDPRPTFLSAGTTHAPLSGPGMGSILHDQLQRCGLINWPVEISSHSGVCTSAAAALVSGIRAVSAGQHSTAVCVGAEHASQVLKANVIKPIDDRAQHDDVRQSQWFMSVFLRFMLSDGAGAFLLRDQPSETSVSLSVDWTYSRSFAHEAKLCMKLDNRTGLLTQDVNVLSQYLVPLADQFLSDCLAANNETLADYSIVLPHMSSYFFRRPMERILKQHADVPYWTNLATAGNTGAASIYVMLYQYLSEHTLRDGQRMLLFIPESGQFNFVMISLTAVVR